VSWPDHRNAPARLTLMVGGIAAGVALIAALGIINASVLANFVAMLEKSAGKAALQVELGTGEVGFDESVVDVVRETDTVRQAFGLVRGTLHAADGSGEVLHLFGVDLASDAADSYDVRVVGRDADEIELLNDPSAVLLTTDYARRRDLALGDGVRFAGPTGLHDLRVRGLLEAEGMATLFGGNLAIMDLFAAQRLMGKDGRVDQIDVILDESTNVDAVRAELLACLPEGLAVNRPSTRGERFERAVGAFQAMLDGLSLLCLLAGVFIVYNASATGVAQRARDLAVILTLGAERRTIFLMVLGEAAVIGFVASGIGIAAGVVLARALTGLVAQSMGVIYQMRFPVDSYHLGGEQVAAYLALGTLGAVVAALVPARKASRLDPLELMRPDYRERLAPDSPNRVLLVVWAGLVVAALLAVVVEQRHRSITWGNVAATLWWLSAVVVSIPWMSWVSRAMQGVLPRFFGLAGRIAAAGLMRAPARTGVTTAVIALSLTLAVTVASVARSFRESERNWFILAGDLVVSAIGTEGGWMESPLAGDVADVLRRVPGVARAETYRVMQGQEFRGSRVAVVGVSPGFVDTAQFRGAVVRGAPDDAVRALRDGVGVVVSDNLADRFGLDVGDEITLPAPAGPMTVGVSAIVTADYSGDQGSVLMHRDLLADRWNDDMVSHVNLFLSEGTDLQAARAAVLDVLRDRYLVKVLTVPQTLAYHQGMVDRAFAFTYAIQLLVVVVTLAGIVDLLTTQVIERRWEIGALRLIGAEERTVSASIVLEGLVIGATGALLGVMLSVGTSLLWVHVNFRILIGYILEHHFAALTALWCVALATGVAVLAALVASRRALRQPILEVLRQD
jgi:putative ABC transport system permease protein